MQHFNDNVLNVLKSTKKMIDSSKTESIKKDLIKLAIKESVYFCRINKFKDVSELSKPMIEALEDDIWVRFEKYGAF